MRIVVVGGTGRIGAGVVGRLAAAGHDAVAASPTTGVDAVTGRGVARALAGADAVVDVTRPASYDPAEVLRFFTASTRTLLDAGRAAGVGHHVVLSVVGCDRLPASGWMRAKVAQEGLVRGSGRPFTIVRATQFFEFVPHVADGLTVDGVVRAPDGVLQPVAAADVADVVARVAVGTPTGGVVDVAGPGRFAFAALVGRVLAADGDPRPVVTDPAARYFGAPLTGTELVPGTDDAVLGVTTVEEWLARRRSSRGRPARRRDRRG